MKALYRCSFWTRSALNAQIFNTFFLKVKVLAELLRKLNINNTGTEK
jgi:hypothetical protein